MSHPAALDQTKLRRQCRVTFGRASGPGGQHRNKVETAARVTHVPTGISAQASERRSQSQNQYMAERRLRLKLALQVRTRPDPHRYTPTTLWGQRRQGTRLPGNPRNRAYPALHGSPHYYLLRIPAGEFWDLSESIDSILRRGNPYETAAQISIRADDAVLERCRRNRVEASARGYVRRLGQLDAEVRECLASISRTPSRIQQEVDDALQVPELWGMEEDP